MLLLILTVKNFLEHKMEINYMLVGKATIILLIVGLIKKEIAQMKNIFQNRNFQEKELNLN